MKKLITALGDSLTKGVVLNGSNRYSVISNNFIEIISDRLGYQVENYGKFGCTIGFGSRMIDRHAEEIAASDYTFLEYGGNDCDFDWLKIADNPAGEHFPKTSLDTFGESFQELVARIRDLGSRPVIISLPPIISDTYFSFFSRSMSEEQRSNVKEWLGGDVGIIARWHESYNRTLFMVAGHTQTPIIDITTPFDTFRGNMNSLYCTDGIHPNENGHRLIAETIINKTADLS